MLDWIKNIKKEYPEFWKNYLLKFNSKSNRFVVLNIETTGIDIQSDKILSIGAIAVIENNIIVNDVFQMSVNETENSVIQEFISFLGNSILIGHRINFDIEMLNVALEKLDCGRLKNEALDIEIMHKKLNMTNESFNIDKLLKIYNIEKPEHFSTSTEAYSIALLFLKLKQRLKL
jgi:DNA polymerase III subunit epsilon